MKKLSGLLTVMLLSYLLTGCGITGINSNAEKQTALPVSSEIQHFEDELFYSEKIDYTFAIMKCNESTYIGTERWLETFNFEPPEEMNNGDFAIVTADVTFLSGGICGYTGNPQIDKLKDFRLSDINTVAEMYNIPDSSELYSLHDSTITLCQNDKLYYILYSGRFEVYKNGEYINTYDDEAEIDNYRVLINNNSVEKELLLEQLDSGIIYNDDYFLISQSEVQTQESFE